MTDKEVTRKLLLEDKAPVAQLDRVSASEAEGRAFKSRQARQTTKGSNTKTPKTQVLHEIAGLLKNSSEHYPAST